MAEEALAKIFQQVQANLKDANATKLSIARKREFVFMVQELIKQLEPKKLIQIQAAVINFVFQLASQTKSGSMIAGLTGLVRFLYSNGGDFTKLVTEFFDPAIAVIQNQRTPSDFRLTIIMMTGKVFKTLWTRCATPPTKELFEAYTKLNAKSTDKSIRAAAYKALKYVIKVNPSNLFQFQNDLIRHLIQHLKNEKSNIIKVQMAACLNVFIQETMNYSNMHNSFDLLFQVCLKGFEEVDDMDLHRNYVTACTNLLNMRLQESYQQGDIKQGFRTYNVTLRENLNAAQTGKRSKASANTVIDVARSFGDMMSLFAAMLLRLLQHTQAASSANGETSELTVAQEGIRKAICQVLTELAEKNIAHLEATDIEIILNSLILTVPTAKDEPEESQRQKLSIVWMIQRFLKVMQDEQKIALLKLCLQTLTQKQLILKMETLQNLTHLLPKNFKVSTMVNEAQFAALLAIVNEILYETSSKCLQANFSNEKEFMDAVTIYMCQPSPLSVRNAAVEVIKTMGSKVSAWTHSMITQVLSMVTISNADILSMRQDAVYVLEAVQDKAARSAIIDQVRTLNCHSTALASVFQHVQKAACGVPVALSTASLNLAKGLILGKFPLDVKTDQEKAMFSLVNMNSITNQRREAGWILMEGLLYLGADWIQSEMSTLMKLFKTVFRKEICVIDKDKMTQPVYRETVFMEFMIKKRATTCLKTLLNQTNIQADQYKSALRQVSSMVCNAVNFFLNTGDKLEIDTQLHKQFGTNQIHGAKSDLFACLMLLPPDAYQTKNVTLLHPIVEVIIHEDGGIAKIPSIFKHLLNREDSHIGPSYSIMSKSTKSSKKAAKLGSVPKLVEMDTRGCLWGVQDFTEYTRSLTDVRIKEFFDGKSLVPVQDATSSYPRQNLLNNAIQLFTQIFLSDKLNDKNKNQLLKHFKSNVQPTMPSQENTKDKKNKDKDSQSQAGELPYYRPEKIQKMIRIALTLLNIVKTAANSEHLHINEEQFVLILAIITSIELSRNDFLIKIVSEAFIVLHAQKIIHQPEVYLEQILAEIESDIGSGQVPAKLTAQQAADRTIKLQRACAIMGILYRNFDYETILSHVGDRMAAVMTRIFRDESSSVRRFSQHYATVMAREGPCPETFYQKMFLNCFHLTQVDLQMEQIELVNLGKLFNTYTKTAEQVDSRSRVTQGDFFDILLEHKATRGKAKLLMVALDLIKYHVLKDPNSLSNTNAKWKSKLFTKALGLLQDKKVKNCVKVKVTELVATLIYKGHLYGLDAESKESLSRIVLDQLNSIHGLESNMVDIKDALQSNNQFEQLINFSSEFNLESNETQDLEAAASIKFSSQVLQRCLQRLFLLIFKINCLANFTSATQFCKEMLAYKHTTPYTILERILTDGPEAQPASVGENYVFQSDMTDETRCFVMSAFQNYVDLYFEVDTSDESRYKAEAGSLLNLAFSTVGHDADSLKKVGFDLILSVVDLLSQVIDRVQDDADDEEEEFQTAEKQRKKQIKLYLESSLLLEQYEAQIFSIIRQNLKGGETQLPSNVLERVLTLILRYITMPICKDEQTIGKIRDLLCHGMVVDPSRIYSQNLNASETFLATSHLKKIVLVSQMIIFSKHGKDILSDSKPSEAIQRKLDSTLPQKFLQEDMTRLQSVVLSGNHRSILVSHLVACLQDALIINLGKRANLAKCKLITFGSCAPQSQLGQELQKSVRYAHEALSILVSHQDAGGQGNGADGIGQNLSRGDSKSVTLSLLQRISQHDIQGSFDQEQIKSYVQGKIAELIQVKCFIDNDACHILKGSSSELSELCDTLISLLGVGVFEINQMVLTLVQSLLKKSFFGVFNQHMLAQKLDSLTDLVNGLFLQALPALIEVNKSESSNAAASMAGFQITEAPGAATSKKDLQVSAPVALSQFKAVLAVTFEMIKNEDVGVNVTKRVVTSVIGRLLCNLEELANASSEDQELKKAVVMQGTQMVNLITSEMKQSALWDQAIVPVYISAVQVLQSRLRTGDYEFTPFSGALMHAMLQAVSQTNSQTLILEAQLALTHGQQAFFLGEFSAPVQTQLGIMARDPLPGKLGQAILASTFTTVYQELLTKETVDEKSILLSLALLLQAYKVRADFAVRVTMLRPFFTMLFSTMQSAKLSAQARNQSVDIFYQVFQTDQLAFRKFAEPDPATGQSWLTMAEKDVISKVVQKYAAMQQSSTAAQPASSTSATAQAKKPTAFVRQPLATAGGNKIKLGRFGKK